MTAPGHDWDESGVRESVADARRLVVKVGSSSISTAQSGLDLDKMAILVSALAARHGLGRDVILVSSGSISAGMAPLGLVRRPRDLAHMQAAAAVGQGLLVQHYARVVRFLRDHGGPGAAGGGRLHPARQLRERIARLGQPDEDGGGAGRQRERCRRHERDPFWGQRPDCRARWPRWCVRTPW